MSLPVSRVAGIPPDILGLCEKSNLTTTRDVLCCSTLDLIELLGLSQVGLATHSHPLPFYATNITVPCVLQVQAVAVLQAVSAHVSPPFITVSGRGGRSHFDLKVCGTRALLTPGFWILCGPCACAGHPAAA